MREQRLPPVHPTLPFELGGRVGRRQVLPFPPLESGVVVVVPVAVPQSTFLLGVVRP